MKISPTFYNPAGELMAPLEVHVNIAGATLGGLPPIEPGFYYRFKFVGRTKAEFAAKERRFFDNMGLIDGYSTLVLRHYTVKMGNFVHYGLDVIYVVESTEQAEQAAKRAREVRDRPQPAAPTMLDIIARR